MQPISSATTTIPYASAEEAIKTWNKEHQTGLGHYRLYNGTTRALYFSFSETKGWSVVSNSNASNSKKNEDYFPTLKDAMPYLLKKPMTDWELINALICSWEAENDKSPCPLLEVVFSDNVSRDLAPQLPLQKLSLERIKAIKIVVDNAKEAFELQKEFRHFAKVIIVNLQNPPFSLETGFPLSLRGDPNSCLVFTEPSEKVARFMLYMDLQYSSGSCNWVTDGGTVCGIQKGVSTNPIKDPVGVFHFTNNGYLTEKTSLMGVIFFKDDPMSHYEHRDTNTKNAVIDEFNKWAAIQSSVLIHETALKIFSGQRPVVELISDYAMFC